MSTIEPEPFEPIVESLLKYPTGSPEFADAARVASHADIAEARRQIAQSLDLFKERQAWIDERLAELEGGSA